MIRYKDRFTEDQVQGKGLVSLCTCSGGERSRAVLSQRAEVPPGCGSLWSGFSATIKDLLLNGHERCQQPPSPSSPPHQLLLLSAASRLRCPKQRVILASWFYCSTTKSNNRKHFLQKTTLQKIRLFWKMFLLGIVFTKSKRKMLFLKFWQCSP